MDDESACTNRGKTRDQPVVAEDELTERDTTGVCKACGRRAVDGVEALMQMASRVSSVMRRGKLCPPNAIA